MDPRTKLVPPAWATPIGDWTLHLTAAGRSPGTIATRTDRLRRASRALGGSPWDVTPDDLTGWTGSQTWARDTRRSTYASLRGFWSWAVNTGRTDTSPAIALPTVSPSPPKPRPAGERALATALERADTRTRLILWLAADAGLRRSEIAQVHRRDLVDDLTGWSLVAHGKGGKDRVVPLTDPLAAAVMRACLAGGGYAFPGDSDGHLSPRWVGTLASNALPDEVTLHMLRHRFATRTHASVGDLLAVQQLLGHASPATTQRYVALDPGRLRAAVAWAA